MSDQLLQKIMDKLILIESNMATKQDVEAIQSKLDTLFAQVAYNTEQEVNVNDLSSKVDEQGTDIKLIKKLLTNQ